MKPYTRTSVYWGVFSGIGMLLFYLGIMMLSMPRAEDVWLNFVSVWYYILAIIIGFGVQAGIWVYMKNWMRSVSSLLPAANTVTSGGAMVACCAHHLIDVFPVFGLSGASLFFTRNQKPLLVLAVSLNMLGIAYMAHALLKMKRKLNSGARAIIHNEK